MKIKETAEIQLVIPITKELAEAVAGRINFIRGQLNTNIIDCELVVESATAGKLRITVERNIT